MFRPNITVATIVHAQEKFLVVEEWVNGKPTWNQPAGHLEANETLLQAAERELLKKQGSTLRLKTAQNTSMDSPDNTPFIRFLFSLELPMPCETAPQDSDIACCHWVSAQDIIDSDNLRSPLVAQSILCFQENITYPLEILSAYGHIFDN